MDQQQKDDREEHWRKMIKGFQAMPRVTKLLYELDKQKQQDKSKSLNATPSERLEDSAPGK